MRARIVIAFAISVAGAWTVAGAIWLGDPSAPTAAPAPPGRFELLGSNRLLARGMNSALAVHGRHAYVGSRTDGSHPDSGVLVVDVSKPSQPRVVGQIGRPSAALPGESSRELRVWHRANLLIVMNFECDEVGHLCAGAPAAGVKPTLRFYDIAGRSAANPRLVATYQPSHNPHEFFLWQDPRRRGRALLYLTTPFSSGADIDRGAAHVRVVDISQARQGRFRELVRWSPAREPRWDQAGVHSLSLSHDGRRLYLADLEGGFGIADTSDLAEDRGAPRIRQLTPADKAVHHEEPGAHSALRLPGRSRYALITDEVYGAAFGLGGAIGFNVLKGCPWGWMRTIDAADPERPQVVGEYKVRQNDRSFCPEASPTQQNGASFSSHNPTLTEHLGLVTWHSAGLQAVSLADPRRPTAAAVFKPRPLGVVGAEDPALSAATEKVVMWSYPVVRDGLVYVVDLRNGLYVLRYRGPFATELGCYDFLEGNSNLVRRRHLCGLDLRLRLRYKRGRRPRRCARSAVRATLRGRHEHRARQVAFYAGRRRVSTDRRRPFSRRIPRRRIRRRHGGTRVLALVTLDDGSRVRVSRRVRRCRKTRRR